MEYRIGEVDVEHRKNFYSASPVAVDVRNQTSQKGYDPRVDYRGRHDRWENNVKSPKGTVYVTRISDLGDTVTISNRALSLARQAEQKAER